MYLGTVKFRRSPLAATVYDKGDHPVASDGRTKPLVEEEHGLGVQGGHYGGKDVISLDLNENYRYEIWPKTGHECFFLLTLAMSAHGTMI